MNWREPVIAKLDLIEVNTAGGDFRFIAGLDGWFTDSLGRRWLGSTLISSSAQDSALNGRAPSGEISFSYYQDPSMPDLVRQMRELGVDYIRNRPITFYVQTFVSQEEFYAPTRPPFQIYKRWMKTMTLSMEGDQIRRLAVTFESGFENRRSAKRRIYNTVDHSAEVGAPNPSLEFVPTNNFQEEKLFG